MSVSYTGSNTYFLFENQTTNGNSAPVSVNYSNKVAIVKFWGTFDGAYVTLQTLAPQTNPEVWLDVPDLAGDELTFESNGQRTMQDLVQNEQVRAVLSNAGAGTTVNVSMEIY